MEPGAGERSVERGVAAARSLLAARFPDARGAWLAGSVVHGTATATSDLDLTVLLAGPPAPFRESLVHEGWPVELFVHSAASVERWLELDRQRRRPTLGRLVAGGLTLVDVDGEAEAVAAQCTEFLGAGPEPLGDGERRHRRYQLTDQLDDLADATDRHLRTAVAIGLWQGAAELLLAEGGCWSGTGKWLVRELQGYDATHGTRFAPRLHGGLLAAIHGEPALLVEVVDEVLTGSGGRLWAGHRMDG